MKMKVFKRLPKVKTTGSGAYGGRGVPGVVTYAEKEMMVQHEHTGEVALFRVITGSDGSIQLTWRDEAGVAQRGYLLRRGPPGLGPVDPTIRPTE